MACRNRAKGEEQRSRLVAQYPASSIEVMVVDVSIPASVYAFCDEFRSRFKSVDTVFCNAGVLPVKGLRYRILFETLLRRGVEHIILTGAEDFLVQSQHLITKEGLGEVFATNIFGHFLLVSELQDMMAGGRIVWTSSTSADKTYFSWDDPQHRSGYVFNIY